MSTILTEKSVTHLHIFIKVGHTFPTPVNKLKLNNTRLFLH